MKLFEFSALVGVKTVIAAETEAEAWKELEAWESGAWLANSDIDEPLADDPQLLDVREAKKYMGIEVEGRDYARESLEDQAHVIVDPEPGGEE